MSNLTKYPLEDGFETSLAQSWDGQLGTMKVNATPNFTFPSGVTTYVVVEPGKTTMQVAETNAYDPILKTITASNITLEKGAGINSIAVNHPVGSKVIISDNYQFWKDILDSVNGKIELVNGQHAVYADPTARDAEITSPSNGMEVYVTSLGLFTDYIGGAWVNRATGAVANADLVTAGKVELATDAEITANTAIGGSGASLVTTPEQLGKSVSLKVLDATMDEIDHIVFDKAGVDNKMLKSVLRTELQASNTIVGTQRIATDAEVTAGTLENVSVNPKQAKDNYGVVPDSITATRILNAISETVTYNHNLGKIPSMIMVTSQNGGGSVSQALSTGSWLNDGNDTNKCIYSKLGDGGGFISLSDSIVSKNTTQGQSGVINNVTSTQFDVTWTLTSSPTASNTVLHFTLTP